MNAGGGGGGEGGVPMSHVDYKKWQYRPVKFNKSSCRHVAFNKVPVSPVTVFLNPYHVSLKDRKCCVAVSILGVYTSMNTNRRFI